MIHDLDNYDTGQELQDVLELMDELRNLVYLSDHTHQEKEDLYDLFQDSLPIDEIKEWRIKLLNRHRDPLTKLQEGNGLYYATEINKACKKAVEKDNT